MDTKYPAPGDRCTVDLPPMATPEQLSELFQVPLQTIYRWRHNGRGPKAVRVGKHLRYPKSSVVTWINEQAAEQAAS